jgi:hypothetical protein
MYILDPLHYKEKWEEIPHVKKKRKLSSRQDHPPKES